MGATRNTGYLENLIQYDASDNVAIATTVNPSYKVTLGGSMLGTSAVFSGNLSLQGAVTRNINFYDSSNTNINAQIQYDQISSNSGQFFFKTSNAGTLATRLTISSTGNATFGNSVTIQGGNALFVNNAANTRFGSLSTTANGTELSSWSGAGEPLFLIAPDTTATIRFCTNGSSSTGERMRITSGGNVGIGITSGIGSRLHIYDSASGSTITRVTFSCGDGGDIRVGKQDGVSNDAILGTWSNNSTVFYSNSTERMRITSGGMIKIPVTNQINTGSNSIKSQDSVTVTTTTTTIFTSQTVGSVDSGNLVVVTGVLSGTGSNFCDVVLFMTNGSATVIGSRTIASPAARTYTVSGNNLQLAMASGTYVVGVGGFIQGYNLSF